ncbi:hypothetical protein DPMN_012424 [Dreissena polymorpha]|uniref:Uncharacterized protein n=1 Tax=Dreissena polymorpha TaxID=45954 RepID=A0A9D4S1C4_DREPO|nr:hypothetical protein DPMN_012424 [Dreissena polymorpha]
MVSSTSLYGGYPAYGGAVGYGNYEYGGIEGGMGGGGGGGFGGIFGILIFCKCLIYFIYFAILYRIVVCCCVSTDI